MRRALRVGPVLTLRCPGGVRCRWLNEHFAVRLDARDMHAANEHA